MGRTVFLNANVIPMEQRAYSGGLVVEGNRIIHMGSDEDAMKYAGDHSMTIDLQGKTLLPGFIESHMHPFSLIWNKLYLNLTDLDSLSDVLDAVKEASRDLEPGKWVMGRGWDDSFFRDVKRFPVKEDLDQQASENPVFLIRVCGHVAVVNSKALEYLASRMDTSELSDGILKENTLEKALHVLPRPPMDRMVENATSVFDDMFSAGLTTVTDMGGTANNLRLYQKIRDRLDFPFKLRVYMMPAFLNDMIHMGIQKGFGGDGVKIMGLKILSDGSLGARTAHLLAPYSDDPGNRGLLNYPPADLYAMVKRATENNLQVAVHAIGDAAASVSVDALDRVGQVGKLRPRLEHCQVLSRDVIDKMRDIGVIASVQPVFASYDYPWVEERIGKDRLEYAYAWRTLRDSDVRLCAGSDSPIYPFDPLLGIWSAVSRKGIRKPGVFGEGQRLDVMDVLRMYTIDAAYSLFEENETGSLKVGKRADMVVLSSDPTRTETDDIREIKVELTMLDGKRVFDAMTP
jgi:predicted amidohydrolase YtcJ